MARYNDDNGSDPCPLGEVKVVAETEKALRVEPKEDEAFWVPKSVIHDDSEVYDNGEHNEGTLVVKRWWGEKEGRA